uniref:O-acyltransferase n=1 Tax=Strombidium rassoulzadegani TaxID=1082188 RepID=A0A7S3CIE8_9SPIT|mmetsp:Transcript_11771/g.19853  ORF Transcript_11771/g.19853 Transcript_11771/m.19853 type:complete len:486 (+) Transcript_11771:447-1904(+)
MAQICCHRKVALQLIQNALDEARRDFKEVGKPLTLKMHDNQHESMLKGVFSDNSSQQSQKVEMAGIMNLLILLLVITNIKNIIMSYQQHGFVLSHVIQDYIRSGVYKVPENYETISAILTIPIFTAIAFWIEILASNQHTSRHLVFSLILLSQVCLLSFPIYVSYHNDSDLILGNLLVMLTISTSLKMISFHHVMHDVRGLVLRVMKAKKEGRKLEPSKTERTIFGVDEQLYEEALTYPKCLHLKHFMRYTFMPTYCFQLSFPLKEKRDWCLIFKRVVESLIALFLVVYLFYQHIVPVCEESVPYFEQGDYFRIMICVFNVSIPGSYIWVMLFYLVFHAWTNLLAECTRFADKRFYSDWWNAGNLNEYWRKWNHPIHNWLVRHVYYPLIRRGLSQNVSKLLTFMVSAAAHEYIVVGTFRVFNMIAFTFMLVNAPLMQIQRQLRNVVSKNTNNLMFWLGYTAIGQPTAILVCYYQTVKKMHAPPVA